MEQKFTQDWQSYGECVSPSVDPEIFFPPSTRNRGMSKEEQREVRKNTQRAKALCRACVVREACLNYALVGDKIEGIWGGTSKSERKTLTKQTALRRRRANGV